MNKKAPLEKRRSKSSLDQEPEAGPAGTAPDPDLDEREFEEFSGADADAVKASPEFKENLRKKLMHLVKNLYGLWVLFLGGISHYN